MKKQMQNKQSCWNRVWNLQWFLLICLGILISCSQSKMKKPVELHHVRSGPSALSRPLILEKRFISARVLHAQKPKGKYDIGVNDVLFVDLADDDAKGKGSRSSGQQQGKSTVSSEGYINLPLVGLVKVKGKTVEQVRQLLIVAYQKFIKDPQVVVEVLEKKSKPIFLVGAFKKPKKIFMTKATNVIQAIAQGGGIGQDADLRHARLIRRNAVVAVDIYAILKEGQLEQNVWLEANDVIYVPDDKDQRVYVLGQVKNPGFVKLVHGKLSLNQAISEVGGLIANHLEVGNARIIRTLTTTNGVLIKVDINRIRDGAAMAFNLQAGDVVYLPKSNTGSWNDIMRAIRPTIGNIFSISNLVRDTVVVEYDR